MVSEISVHSCLAPLLWACGRGIIHYLTPGSKEIGEEVRVPIFPSRAYAQWPSFLLEGSTSASFQHLPMIPSWGPSFVLFCFVVGRVWTQRFMLAKQTLYGLSHTSSPFFLWLFWRWSLRNYLPGSKPDQLPKQLGLHVWVTGAQQDQAFNTCAFGEHSRSKLQQYSLKVLGVGTGLRILR
jgi:hypothetical protein